MDGFGTPAQHVSRVASLGMGAMALTEHGNVSSHVQLEKAALKAGIKPIFGLEAYTAPYKTRQKWHLTLLAMNQEGLRNLYKLVELSYSEGFYQWPTISGENLARYSEGLICLSGCSDSLLSCTLLGGKSLGEKREVVTDTNMSDAIDTVHNFKEIFDDGRYYIEVQRFPGLKRTKTLNSAYADIHRTTGVRLCASSDVHYPLGTDNEMQKILHAAGRGTGSVEAVEAAWEYDILLCPPTSDAEIGRDLVATGLTRREAWSAVCATADIASRCNVTLPKAELFRFPLTDVTNVRDAQDYIWQLLRKGWSRRISYNKYMQKNKTKYKKQLNYEMEAITSKDYIDYFLLCAEAVMWSKNNEIAVGPARGSAAASVVCYLLGITEVDPMRFPNMTFERFIDVSRTDMPDIDLDFPDDRRDEVRMHMVQKYGADRVGNVGNFTRYRGKNAINDVSRVYKIPYWDANTLKDLVIDRPDGDPRQSDSVEDTVRLFPTAKRIFERYPVLNRAMDLEGNYRGSSVHAAGIVVSSEPMYNICAMQTRVVNGETKTVIAYDKRDAEYLGMMKMDFLGLKTMGMISKALEIIGMSLEEFYRIELDDVLVLNGFSRSDLVGIFQFEGRSQRIVNRDVRPSSFMHLADISALARPGALVSGTTSEYVRIKRSIDEYRAKGGRNKHKLTYGNRTKKQIEHPIIEEICKWTYGQIVYQEQVLAIIRQIGGFDPQRVGEIRRVIGKKLGVISFNLLKEEFLSGALNLHGLATKDAQRIWNHMVDSSSYSFNVAHSVSYAMLAYWQMWIKVYYPLAFYTSSLQKMGDQKEEREFRLPLLLRDAKKREIQIFPPSLESGLTWTAVELESVATGIKKKTKKTKNSISEIGNNVLKKRKKMGLEVKGAVTANKNILETGIGIGAIRAGFLQIPGIGPSTCSAILKLKTQGCLKNWKDLMQIKGVGIKTAERIVEFCCSHDPFGVDLAVRTLGAVRMALPGMGLAAPQLDAAGLGAMSEVDEQGVEVDWLGIFRSVKYRNYLEQERTRSGKTDEEILEGLKGDLRGDSSELLDSCVLRCYDDSEEDMYLRFNRFVFPEFRNEIEDLVSGSVVLVSGIKRNDFGVGIHVRSMVVLEIG